MHKLLAWYHGITRAASAACFVAVALFILYQLGGQVFPYVPRSADEFAGYCMGAAAFLGLADALRLSPPCLPSGPAVRRFSAVQRDEG